MKTTLSLIIPVYKVEAYIEACLCSVLQQLPDWAEVIIVDDGSPDDSIDIAEEVLCRYPQLKPQVSILRQHNRGLSEARNSGIVHAEGQHVGFLDSDDVLLEGYFSILGRLLADNPLADIVAFNAQRFSVMNNGQIQPDCTTAIVPGNAAPQSVTRIWRCWRTVSIAACGLHGRVFTAKRYSTRCVSAGAQF